MSEFERAWLDRWVSEEPSLSLADFLLARYAEEEAIAARADGSAWRAVSEQYPIGAFKGGHLVHVHAPRWRADIAAKRAIVRMSVGATHEGPVIVAVYRPVLAQLALPYAGHPDFREEWRA